MSGGSGNVITLRPKPPPEVSPLRRVARRVLREALQGVGEGTVARRRLEDPQGVLHHDWTLAGLVAGRCAAARAELAVEREIRGEA